ncbi:MAG: radical SAM protein [Phycisphaerae bacterium]|nr:radical SAM protein [Phycisphaerae bacterium]
MDQVSREFQIFAKPVGSRCNLNCRYCYYLEKRHLYTGSGLSFQMPDEILEAYIVQHIEASTDKVISFCWHGGEPTLFGLDSFRKIIGLQRKHQLSTQRIVNGIQTHGTLLDEQWCRFLAGENFAVGLSLDGPREIHDK